MWRLLCIYPQPARATISILPKPYMNAIFLAPAFPFPKTKNQKLKTVFNKKAHEDITPWALVSQPVFRLEVEEPAKLHPVVVAGTGSGAPRVPGKRLHVFVLGEGVTQAELDGLNGPEPQGGRDLVGGHDKIIVAGIYHGPEGAREGPPRELPLKTEAISVIIAPADIQEPLVGEVVLALHITSESRGGLPGPVGAIEVEVRIIREPGAQHKALALADGPRGQQRGGARQVGAAGGDNRDEHGGLHRPVVQHLTGSRPISISPNKVSRGVVCVLTKCLSNGKVIAPVVSPLPARRQVGHQAPGLAVISGLAVEVLFIGELRLDMRGFGLFIQGAGDIVTRSQPVGGDHESRGVHAQELLGYRDLGRPVDVGTAVMEPAVRRGLREELAEEGPVLAEQKFGLGPIY